MVRLSELSVPELSMVVGFGSADLLFLKPNGGRRLLYLWLRCISETLGCDRQLEGTRTNPT